MNAIGCCGLQLYNYGQAVSIVFFTDSWQPDSFYDKIKQNRDLGFHTLCLLGVFNVTNVSLSGELTFL
jgi:diphthine synthase